MIFAAEHAWTMANPVNPSHVRIVISMPPPMMIAKSELYIRQKSGMTWIVKLSRSRWIRIIIAYTVTPGEVHTLPARVTNQDVPSLRAGGAQVDDPIVLMA